jgi:hypothetical protein
MAKGLKIETHLAGEVILQVLHVTLCLKIWNFWDLGTRCTSCVQELIGPSRYPFRQNLKVSEYKVKLARQGDPRDSSNQ